MKKVSRATAVEVWAGLSRVHSSMSAALERDMLPRAGIPLGWYEVLSLLDRAPGAMLRLQDLAREAGLTESGASRRIDQMIKARLIDRHSCPTDRRGVYAHMTEAGRLAYEKAHAVFIRSVTRNLNSQLDADAVDAVHSALGRQ
ncbi:MAG TPA: MarR family transcriptional regulator [Candidatus Dormibacteraeota bacterium]